MFSLGFFKYEFIVTTTKIASIAVRTPIAGHSLEEKSTISNRNEQIKKITNRKIITRKSIAFKFNEVLGSTPVKFLKNILLTFLTTLRNSQSYNALGYAE